MYYVFIFVMVDKYDTIRVIYKRHFLIVMVVVKMVMAMVLVRVMIFLMVIVTVMDW